MLKKINTLLQERNTGMLVIIFTILPFILLSFFNVPLGDDFWYAKAFLENGFIDTQIKWYNEWSGRYMATFAISTLNPLAYGYLKLAFIHPLLLIIGTVLSIKLLVYNVVDGFGLELNKMLFFSLILFFYFNYLPDIGESFYWMAGAYTYQLPVIFFILYLNSLLHIHHSKKVMLNLFFAIFCLFIVIGSNEVFALYACAINTLVFLMFSFYNKNTVNRFLPLLIATFILAIFMIFAPGNFTRESIFIKSDFHLVKSSLNALSRSVFVQFFWLPSLTFILLLVPGIYKISFPEFKLPNINLLSNKLNLVLFGLFFLLMVLFVGFFPSIYATNWIPQRAYTPIFFVFITMASVLIFIFIVKIKRLYNLNQLISNNTSSSLIILIAVITLSHNSNVMNAYSDLTSGKAIGYYKQVTETYEMLEKASSIDTIFVKKLVKKPLVLPIRWPDKPNGLANAQWESYFNIEHVELE